MFYFYFFVLLKAGIWKPSGLFKQNLLSINKTNFSNNRTFLSYPSTKAFSFSLESVISKAERATIHFYIPKTKDWCFKWKNESVDESTCIACRRLLACTKLKSSTGTNLYMIFFFLFLHSFCVWSSVNDIEHYLDYSFPIRYVYINSVGAAMDNF